MVMVVFVLWVLFILHLHVNHASNLIVVNVIPFNVLIVKVGTFYKIIRVKVVKKIVKLVFQLLSVRSVRTDSFMILFHHFVLTLLNKEEVFTLLLTPLSSNVQYLVPLVQIKEFVFNV